MKRKDNDPPDSTIMRISRLPLGRMALAAREYRPTSALTCQILYEIKTGPYHGCQSWDYSGEGELTRAKQVQTERDSVEVLHAVRHHRQ